MAGLRKPSAEQNRSNKRELGKLLKRVQKDDLIICAELSRLGRNLFMHYGDIKYLYDQRM